MRVSVVGMEANQVRDTSQHADDPSRVVEAYWSKRASEEKPEAAVHPKSRFIAYEMWTRRMIQAWTMRRLHSLKARVRRSLDIGCGYGDWTELFAQISDEIHACDIAPAFVDATRRRVPQANVSLADLRSYAMPRALDFVYFGAVLLYAPQPDVVDVLRRVRDAAEPGALVIVRDWCTFNLGRRTTNTGGNHWSIHRSPMELCCLAEAARFRVIEVRSSPSIYGEVMGGRFAQWPMRALWRLVSLPVRRASHSLILRAD
ncbi:MAG TPA: class I SAM-dependent methyltransferase [Kofleriaceae bacterium]